METKNGNDSGEGQVLVVTQRDSLIPSPSTRAFAVWKILNERKQKPTNWDIVCFCVEYLGTLVVDYPFLLRLIKLLNQNVYAIHYHSEGLMDSFVDIMGKEK